VPLGELRNGDVAGKRSALDQREGVRLKNKKLDAALDLARQGFAVFPLVPNGKQPLLEGVNWRKIATTHEGQLRQWWAENPDANIGLLMDGFVAIDIDPRNGGDESWKQFLDLPELLGDELPETRKHTTWSGGSHIIYRQPPGANIGCSQGKARPWHRY
jgi:Bifunctional DNA primase/polymerase, N-terminal